MAMVSLAARMSLLLAWKGDAARFAGVAEVVVVVAVAPEVDRFVGNDGAGALVDGVGKGLAEQRRLFRVHVGAGVDLGGAHVGEDVVDPAGAGDGAAEGGVAGIEAAVVIAVELEAKPQLAEVAEAFHRVGGGPGAVERGQEDADQQGDDADDDEQFDERKSPVCLLRAMRGTTHGSYSLGVCVVVGQAKTGRRLSRL
jgi:hypothetical protein